MTHSIDIPNPPKQVRIFKPTRTAMQSGRSKTKLWVVEYETETARRPEPLMGWTASGDTLNQVRMKFDSMEQAIAFVEKKGWTYTLVQPQSRRLTPRNYGDNFKFVPFADKGDARSKQA